ncbi:MAG: leucine-rich repeat protein [Oscillospiraceae bacterium]
MKKNKIITITVAILSCMSISGIGVSAETTMPISNENMSLIRVGEDDSSVTILKSGKCGDNLTWTLDKDMTLTISGTGDMYDFVETIPMTTILVSGSFTGVEKTGCYTVPWKDYRENIKSIIIEDGITSIGELSFLGCTNVTSIIIPSSVTTIGENAFSSRDSYDTYQNKLMYTNKRMLVIPPSVTSLPDKFYSGGRIIVCASNSEAETCAILNGIPYITVPFNANNNSILSVTEIEALIYQKGLEEGNIITSTTKATTVTTTKTTTMTKVSATTTYNPSITTYNQYDCNHDGIVNLVDLISLKRYLFGNMS